MPFLWYFTLGGRHLWVGLEEATCFGFRFSLPYSLSIYFESLSYFLSLRFPSSLPIPDHLEHVFSILSDSLHCTYPEKYYETSFSCVRALTLKHIKNLQSLANLFLAKMWHLKKLSCANLPWLSVKSHLVLSKSWDSCSLFQS